MFKVVKREVVAHLTKWKSRYVKDLVCCCFVLEALEKRDTRRCPKDPTRQKCGSVETLSHFRDSLQEEAVFPFRCTVRLLLRILAGHLCGGPQRPSPCVPWPFWWVVTIAPNPESGWSKQKYDGLAPNGTRLRGDKQLEEEKAIPATVIDVSQDASMTQTWPEESPDKNKSPLNKKAKFAQPGPWGFPNFGFSRRRGLRMEMRFIRCVFCQQ